MKLASFLFLYNCSFLFHSLDNKPSSYIDWRASFLFIFLSWWGRHGDDFSIGFFPLFQKIVLRTLFEQFDFSLFGKRFGGVCGEDGIDLMRLSLLLVSWQGMHRLYRWIFDQRLQMREQNRLFFPNLITRFELRLTLNLMNFFIHIRYTLI